MDKNFFWVFIGLAFLIIILIGARVIPFFLYISTPIILALIVVGIIVAIFGKGALKHPCSKKGR